MTALVVYETSFGNTAAIARAISDGIAQHMPVRVVAADDSAAKDALKDALEDALVVVGGPTHAFGMSRPETRRQAQERRDAPPRDRAGIREWIEALPADPADRRYATFDTRVTKVRHLPGSAARGAERALHRAGHRTLVRGESFYVADVEGPLLPGEESRARDWGDRLGRAAVGGVRAQT